MCLYLRRRTTVRKQWQSEHAPPLSPHRQRPNIRQAVRALRKRQDRGTLRRTLSTRCIDEQARRSWNSTPKS